MLDECHRTTTARRPEAVKRYNDDERMPMLDYTNGHDYQTAVSYIKEYGSSIGSADISQAVDTRGEFGFLATARLGTPATEIHFTSGR